MSALRVIIAGGGTGGHIFPAIAIAQALERLAPGCTLQFAGAKGRMEMEKVPQAGYAIEGLDIAGFNRSNLLSNWSLPLKIWRSRRQANALLTAFRPDVVVGVGGYASFPVLSAAQSKGIPTLIQEQNSFAGKSNKILGRKAKSVCVAYDGMQRFFPADRIALTGNPVRRQISASRADRASGCAHFSLDPQKKTLLIVGGSLGARSVNQAIATLLPELRALGLQLIWQTGKEYCETALEAAQGAPDVSVRSFIQEMDQAYAAADFVISRAGALAIAELTIVAKPTVFVPYPYAAEDHQTHNAQALVRDGAALMVADDALAQQLLPALRHLTENEALCRDMSAKMNHRAIADADRRIAEKIKELAV